MKPKSYKEKETLRERGSKKFQERLAEEKEAKEEIKQFTLNEEGTLANDNTPTIQELLR
jgi:hypothetical protein